MVDSWIHPQQPLDLAGSTLTAYVLFDLFLIVFLARVLGSALVRVRQPRVVGEILAGLLIGPTLIGEDLSFFLAPAQARPIISSIATVALILFMFLAGVEFDVAVVKGRKKQAGVLALLAVAVPLLAGIPLAATVHDSTFAGPAALGDFFAFALFIGAVLSVTAFPVLAHILMERNELNTDLGGLAVATAAIMSVLMFELIGVAATFAAAGSAAVIGLKVVLSLVFGAISWFLIRPFLDQKIRMLSHDGGVTPVGLSIVFCGALLFGLIGELLGIHAMVGGFVWGVVMPVDPMFRKAISNKLKDVVTVLLLPVFFAVAGFSADLKLLSSETMGTALLVLFAAVGSKFLAAIPARRFGLSWREVGMFGALINTRGLLVLVVGLIGLDLGMITAQGFTVLVLVALVTNLMTVPILDKLSGHHRSPARVTTQV